MGNKKKGEKCKKPVQQQKDGFGEPSASSNVNSQVSGVSDEQPKTKAVVVVNAEQTVDTNVNASTEASLTICVVCQRNLPGEWVVQCDDCDRQFHYDCVGYDELTPENEPWSCPECLGKVLSSTALSRERSKQSHVETATNIRDLRLALQQEYAKKLSLLQLSHDRSSEANSNVERVVEKGATASESNIGKVRNGRHGNARLVETTPNKQYSVRTGSTNSKSTEVHSITSTIQPNHSKTQTKSLTGTTTSSKNSRTSSQRRRDIELQKLQEEYELQQKFDEEKLKLEMKALQLKEIREKKLIEAKYRVMEEIVSVYSESSADTEAVTRKSTCKNSNSKAPEHSKLVESWVLEQRGQNYKPNELDDDIDPNVVSNTLGVNISVPINSRELNRINRRRGREEIQKENPPHVSEETFVVERNSWPLTSVTPAYHGNQNNPTSRTYDGHVAGAQGTSGHTISNHQVEQNALGNLNSQPMNSQPLNSNRVIWNSKSSQPNRQSKPISNPVLSQDREDGHPFDRQKNNNRMSGDPNNCQPNQQSTRINPSLNPFRTEQHYDYQSSRSTNSSRNQLQTNTQLPGRALLSASQIASRHSMPKDLPLYYGHPQEWPQFIKRYQNTTVLCGYDDNENLERLNKCLRSPARDIVESLLVMPECVGEIIETLREKFGRPELIAKATLAKVRAEPTIKGDKLEPLSDFGYKVRNACNVIESMGLHYYLYNPELIQDVIAKLPYQIKIEWARYADSIQANNQQINLRAIAEWLHKLSRTLNQITTLDLDSIPSDRKIERKSDKVKGGYLNVHEVKPTTSEEYKKCVSCSSSCKSVGECSKFKSLSTDERWKCVLENEFCKKCLTKHDRRKCQDKNFRSCGVNGCELKHNSLLHNEERHSKYRTDTSNGGKQKSIATAGKVNKKDSFPPDASSVNPKPIHTHRVDGESELFRIVPVNIKNDGNSVKTFAFLDEGSSYTLLEKETALKLNAEGVPETICLLWTNGIHRQEETTKVNLEISGVNNDDSTYQLQSVNVVEELGLSPQTVDPNALMERFEYLKGLPLPKYHYAIPTILIGMKHIRLTTPIETVEGEENQPIASRSRLGWSVYGPTDGTTTFSYNNHHKVIKCPCTDRDNDLHEIVKEHFTIENFGVSVSSTNLESQENQKALEMLEKFTVRNGKRFETRLLWKNEAYVLPDSYGMARKRLNCLENKGPATVKLINDIIEDYIVKGYASKLSAADLEEKHSRTFYLPIFTVTNPKKPEKIRPVFDAAATVHGVSLNSTLLTGPDLLSPLIDILRRFREHKIAVVGDIKEMFYRVWMNKVDRNSQRFLWRNGDKDREPDVYQFNVMTFGSKCSPSSAQFVKNKNASEYKHNYPRAAKSIVENHYVDDMLDGTESVEEAVKLINDVKFVHSQAGFEIRNFKCNSKEVLTAIGEPIESRVVDLAEGNTNVERVLGMFWETTSDSFMFSLKYTKISPEILNGKTLPTKRQLLSLVMSLYDPLGLISYYVIHAKILLQDVWRAKIGWDDSLPCHLANQWNRWIELLPLVERLKVPRWYSKKLAASTKNELHIFVDAGEDAFAAIAYIRVDDDEGVECSLIGSKARVTPLKYLSIPRKELMAAVLGARLVNSVEKGLSLKIDRRVIWSDSITVLTWLHSEHKKYSQFVAHRVGEILEITNVFEWRWVPSKLNVADEATKWSKEPTFDASDRWFTGTQFLQNPESEWPEQKIIKPNSINEEMKVSYSHSTLIIPSIVEANKFSTWQRLVRAIGNAQRIVKWMIAKHRKTTRPSLTLTSDDLLYSERKLFRQAQWEGFTEEMVILSRNKLKNRNSTIDKGSSIADCSPYLDEFGIMRVKGRIDAATAVSVDAKRPIILPRDNAITKLIVLSYHVKFKHQNHETVVNELRQKFYIPRVRTVLKSVRWNCQLCVLKRCKPIAPQMADLPAIRFETGIRPFKYTGLDYFGPIFAKVGRQRHKRWGVIYTCLTIRGVWIDVVPSYDTQACILSIRDFVNRKGAVKKFFSDNGLNFKGADNELTREMKKIDFQRLSDEFTSSYTSWLFNPPETPHMGGMWERLIRSIKTSLDESMITRTPTDQMLKSWLIEAENIVNSHPLTFVPLESEEDEALTPNHFILGSSNGMKPPGKFKNDGPYLREQWKEVQRCADIFWKRFIHEYVPTLVRRTKWLEPVKPLEVGDLVINFDENAPRNTYKRGRIVETIMGTNKQVRRAKVQFANGNTLWRSAHHLGLLDVNAAPTQEVGLHHPKDDKNRGENVGATISTGNSKNVTSNVARSVESVREE